MTNLKLIAAAFLKEVAFGNIDKALGGRLPGGWKRGGRNTMTANQYNKWTEDDI